MRVSVVIPTRDAGARFAELLESLLSQSVQAEILVVDSGSRDGTAETAERFAPRVQLLRIPPESFDHGGTRHEAIGKTEGEFVVFLSQDALPAGGRALERLLAPFSDPAVAGAFGRQVAYPDAPAYEKISRAFSYPAESRVWREEDVPGLGIRGYFFSDVFAAYRRSAYEAAGGFDRPVPSNEDMLMAAKLLKAGWALAYEGDAEVYHSHHFTLLEEFRRYRLIGRAMRRYADRLEGTSDKAEGLRMLREVGRRLLRGGKPFAFFAFLVRLAVRFAGKFAGAAEERCRR